LFVLREVSPDAAAAGAPDMLRPESAGRKGVLTVFSALPHSRLIRPPGAGPIAIRTVLRIVDVLPFMYLIGFTVLLTAGKGRQRRGDVAADTAVARG
jgi:hypothetical protein